MWGCRLATAQVATHGAQEFAPGVRTASIYVALDVVIQEFVRIELGTVTGKEVEGNPAFRPGKPGLAHTRLMHRMAVDDQEHRTSELSLQSGEELSEHPRREAGQEHPEQQLTLVGQGRDLVAAKVLARARDHRGLAPRAEGAAGGLVRRSPISSPQ